MSLISVKNLSISFLDNPHKKIKVIEDVNLHVSRGEFLVILGPSGCGKSTLLRAIAGLMKDFSGEILFDKEFKKEKISFVFQDFGLLPWLSVYDNVALGLIGAKKDKDFIREKVEDILKRFGLLQFKNHRPKDLSGGMRQRVGLARAFVTDPELIFLDEPFSELDFLTAENLRKELIDIWKEKGTTIVMVSHYVDEAVELSDHVAVFSPRPGTIKKIFKNDLPRPRNSRSPEFFRMEDELKAAMDNK